MFRDASLPVAIFKRQADVDAGDETGSHDFVTALNKAYLWRQYFSILLMRSCIAGYSIVSNDARRRSSVKDILIIALSE